MLAADAGLALSPEPATAEVAAPSVHPQRAVPVSMPSDLVVVDPGVEDLATLLDGIPGGAEIAILSDSRGGIEQITELINAHAQVRSLHVISHGNVGELRLGDQRITVQDLEQQSSQIQSWADRLVEGADILLYGCHVGRGAVGQRFVSRLAQLSGADVAASTNVTGSSTNGADWKLERSVGIVESPLAIGSATQRNYEGVFQLSVYVAGTTGKESFDLQIDGSTVASFTGVGGDPEDREFIRFDYDSDGIAPEQVRVVFTNDLYRPSQDIDRNLIVDRITIDGVDYQTEAVGTLSTGTWNEGSVEPGFYRSEVLHTNGYFEFANPSNQQLSVRARGAEGGETFEVEADGVRVGSFTATRDWQSFSLAMGSSDPTSIRVIFTNDRYEPDRGFDRNLIVDKISTGDQTLETEHRNVFSTGTWIAGRGVVAGFWQTETLHTNGYFEYRLTESSGPGLGNLEARSADGSGNNLLDATWGSAGSPLTRVTEPSYGGDGSGTVWEASVAPSNPQLPPNAPQNIGTAPQPADVVEAIYAPGSDQERPNVAGLNEYAQFFGQFVTHDMVQSNPAPQGPPIFLDGNDFPVFRTAFELEDGVRQQQTIDTAFLDLGLVYGKDASAAELLREKRTENGESVAGAKLFAGGNGDLLPSYRELAEHQGLTVEEVQQVVGVTPLALPAETLGNQFATGDERANQSAPLLAHHTVWHRNHNWHVARLQDAYPEWSQEQLYQAARALNEADFQNVIYEEYLPSLLGDQALPDYSGYDPDVDPSIINEWTTVAFRFGHDQSSETLFGTREDGTRAFDTTLAETFALANASEAIRSDENLGDWLRGLTERPTQEIDGRVNGTIREALFSVPNAETGEPFRLNLPAIDIHRGRDHGVGDYNALRSGLGLQTYESLEAFAADNDLDDDRLGALKSVYADVSELDSIVGGLLEKKAPGSQLGETFTQLTVMQFENVRAGDRLFALNRFADAPEILAETEPSRMSDILVRVQAMDYAYRDAFAEHQRRGGTNGNDRILGDEGRDLLIGFDGRDRLYGGAGNDDLFGASGHDLLYGGTGNDVIVGGSGYDIVSGGAGKDRFVFQQKSDVDVVTDFSSEDTIDVSDFGLTSTEELLAEARQYGWSVRIKIGNDQLILHGVRLGQLGAHQFVV